MSKLKFPDLSIFLGAIQMVIAGTAIGVMIGVILSAEISFKFEGDYTGHISSLSALVTALLTGLIAFTALKVRNDFKRNNVHGEKIKNVNQLIMDGHLFKPLDLLKETLEMYAALDSLASRRGCESDPFKRSRCTLSASLEIESFQAKSIKFSRVSEEGGMVEQVKMLISRVNFFAHLYLNKEEKSKVIDGYLPWCEEIIEFSAETTAYLYNPSFQKEFQLDPYVYSHRLVEGFMIPDRDRCNIARQLSGGKQPNDILDDFKDYFDRYLVDDLVATVNQQVR